MIENNPKSLIRDKVPIIPFIKSLVIMIRQKSFPILKEVNLKVLIPITIAQFRIVR